MGASKRAAESFSKRSSTLLEHETAFLEGAVGNVLRFLRVGGPAFQAAKSKLGGLSHHASDIIRYFMLIPEAAQFGVQRARMGRGARSTCSTMGEPVRIAIWPGR